MEFNALKSKFSYNQIISLNPLVLALIGDAVYEVFARTYVLHENNEMNVHKIHKKVVSFVKAHAQSDYMKKIINELTEEEMSIFKRGRNAKSSVPKNADVSEYRWATGFEALIGFLYLSENDERLNFVINKIISIHEEGQNAIKS